MSRRARIVTGVLAVALIAGIAVGIGINGSNTGSAPPPSATTTTTSLPAGAQTLTQPLVVQRPDADTTPEADLPGNGRPVVYLGDMNTYEQFVVGALYRLALQQAGYDVAPTRNIGTTGDSLKALEEGSLDLFPEYLDTWDQAVAGIHTGFRSLRLSYEAGVAYADEHHFRLLAPTPASNTTGFAVTSQFAREDDLHSLGQLRRIPELTFGVPLTYGGLWKVAAAYHFKVGTRQNVLTGDQYSQLRSGEIQVAWVSTTDPQLGLPGYTLLSDPKHLFGFGNIVPVTTPAVVKAEGPAFVSIINRVDALLTTRALRGLNAEVELYGHDPTTVALDFLKGNGVLPPTRYQVSSS